MVSETPPRNAGGLEVRRPTMGSGSSRKDFNPALEEESDKLQQQIDEETHYRDTVIWSIGILQQSVDDLEKQLEQLENDQGFSVLDAEYKSRTETQENLNNKYEEQITWYEDEMTDLKTKLKKGVDYMFDEDLDDYTELELQHMVQALEKQRNLLTSDLKTNGWLLDSHSKGYYHNKEVAEAYRCDLNFVNRSLEDFWRQFNLRKTSTRNMGGYSPITSPGSIKWSDESGIHASHRILDPRKGPIRKTASVRSLPKLEFKEIDAQQLAKKKREARSRFRGTKMKRAVSLDSRRPKQIEDPPNNPEDKRRPYTGDLPVKKSELAPSDNETSQDTETESHRPSTAEHHSHGEENTSGNGETDYDILRLDSVKSNEY